MLSRGLGWLKDQAVATGKSLPGGVRAEAAPSCVQTGGQPSSISSPSKHPPASPRDVVSASWFIGTGNGTLLQSWSRSTTSRCHHLTSVFCSWQDVEQDNVAAGSLLDKLVASW